MSTILSALFVCQHVCTGAEVHQACKLRGLLAQSIALAVTRCCVPCVGRVRAPHLAQAPNHWLRPQASTRVHATHPLGACQLHSSWHAL